MGGGSTPSWSWAVHLPKIFIVLRGLASRLLLDAGSRDVPKASRHWDILTCLRVLPCCQRAALLHRSKAVRGRRGSNVHPLNHDVLWRSLLASWRALQGAFQKIGVGE